MIPYDYLYGLFSKHVFDKIGSTGIVPLLEQSRLSFRAVDYKSSNKNAIILYDQEPIDLDIFFSSIYRRNAFLKSCENKLIITSEYSQELTKCCRDYGLVEAHYFYHALLCHEWYRMYWYKNIEVTNNFDRVYITYNNLTDTKRLYRSNLIIELSKRNLLDCGYVSYNSDYYDQTIDSLSRYQLLPAAHKNNIINNTDLLKRKMVIDTEHAHGGLSAELDVAQFQRAFVSLVTETVFYENKVHLTEKIFKPIIAKVPFILMAGAGNLAYLKKYGFKTFGDFWDESYDLIQDPVQRFDAILKLLEDLSAKPQHELEQMKLDMADILEYNFNHFYKTMKPVVVRELIENLSIALDKLNLTVDQQNLLALEQALNV